jgi:hypothetical protein
MPMRRLHPPPLHRKVQSIALATLHRLPPRELLKSARIVGTISFFAPLLRGQQRSLFLISQSSSVSWLSRRCSRTRSHSVVHSYWRVPRSLPRAISHFLFFDSNLPPTAVQSVA